MRVSDAGLGLGGGGQRHVNGHLVAVEVGVEGGADQRMQLDGLAFDQDGLEGLDAEAVKRGRTVKKDRVLTDHIVEDIPHFGALTLDLALRGLHVQRVYRIGAGTDEIMIHIAGRAIQKRYTHMTCRCDVSSNAR